MKPALQAMKPALQAMRPKSLAKSRRGQHKAQNKAQNKAKRAFSAFGPFDRLSPAQRFMEARKRQKRLESRDERDTVLGMYEGYMDFRRMFLRAKEIGSASRVPNFPEPISEQMVCFLLKRLRGWDVRWDPKAPGDLQWEGSRLEVKCVSSAGPISFGPREEWEKLYILEHKILREKTRGRPAKTRVCCWEINARHDDDIWQVVKISRKQSFSEQRDEGKRPHITLEKLMDQIAMHKIFEGTVGEAIFGPR